MTTYSEEFGRGGLNPEVDAGELREEIGLDADEIDFRKSFVGFDRADERRLRRYRERFESQVEDVVDAFYDNVTDYEETAAVVDRSPKDVEELRRTQAAYLVSLADGEYDVDYFENRARIGKLHELLDMSLKYYLGQYAIYYEVLGEIVAERTRERLSAVAGREHDGATADGGASTAVANEAAEQVVEEGFAEFCSMLKLLNLDAQVAVDTYIHSYVSRLERERDRFAALFENLPTPAAGVRFEDGEAVIARVNAAFEGTFATDEDELEGETLDRLLAPVDRSAPTEPETAAVDGPESTWAEAPLTLETSTGRREFFELVAPVEDERLAIDAYTFYVDVTDERQLQQQLRVLSRTLRHDIRTHMTLVRGHAESLEEVTDDPAVARRSAEIETAADRLLEISDRTRKVAELDRDAEPDPISVADLVEAVVCDVREREVACDVSTDVPEDLWVYGNDALEVAIDQLVENAIEHSDRARPTVEIAAVESFEAGYVDLKVADDGPGIPTEEYELVTGERRLSQLDHSSGLGLWTVEWIVTNLGGTLEFEANVPRGTVVTVTLPRALAG